MAEYIERDAATKIAEKYGLACGSALGRHSGISDCIASEIFELPAADVAPVVHGEWLLRHIGYGHYWECSVCHKNPCIYVTEDTKFCPNCGARMDGET